MGLIASIASFFTGKKDFEKRVMDALSEVSSASDKRISELESKIASLSAEMEKNESEHTGIKSSLHHIRNDIGACSRITLSHEERLSEIESIKTAVGGEEELIPPERDLPEEERIMAKPKSSERILGRLTLSERMVVNVLLDADYPLSYKEIAERIKKNPVTAKAYINSLKKKGFPFDETAANGRKKVYSLAKKFRVELMSGMD